MDADWPLHWAHHVQTRDSAGPGRLEMWQPWELIPGVPRVVLCPCLHTKSPLKPKPSSLCCALVPCPCGAWDRDAISHGTGGSGQPSWAGLSLNVPLVAQTTLFGLITLTHKTALALALLCSCCTSWSPGFCQHIHGFVLERSVEKQS